MSYASKYIVVLYRIMGRVWMGLRGFISGGEKASSAQTDSILQGTR